MSDARFTTVFTRSRPRLPSDWHSSIICMVTRFTSGCSSRGFPLVIWVQSHDTTHENPAVIVPFLLELEGTSCRAHIDKKSLRSDGFSRALMTNLLIGLVLGVVRLFSQVRQCHGEIHSRGTQVHRSIKPRGAEACGGPIQPTGKLMQGGRRSIERASYTRLANAFNFFRMKFPGGGAGGLMNTLEHFL